MASLTYYVVVGFYRDGDGILVGGEGQEAPNGEAAKRRARAAATAPGATGALAFSRTGDPAMGEWGEATVLAEFGEVDRTALGE